MVTASSVPLPSQVERKKNRIVFGVINNRRKYVVFSALLSLVVMAEKAYGGDYYHLRQPVQHYLNIHIAGGENSPFLTDVKAPEHTYVGPSFIAGAGGEAKFGLSYEIRYRRFFFNIGGELDGNFQNFKIANFTDTLQNTWLPTKNHDQTPVTMSNTYMFQHTNFEEHDTEWRWAIPVQFGFLFNSYFYGAVGLKYSMSWMTSCTAKTTMKTTMILDNAISFNGEPFQVNDQSPQADLYGIYPSNTYEFTSQPKDSSQLGMSSYSKLNMLSPTLEIGARIPLAYRTVLRIGAYVEYAIPLAWEGGKPHVDYSELQKKWWSDPTYVRQPEDLNLLIVNPLKSSDWTVKGYTALSVGIRATLSFNITPTKHWCNCENDIFKPAVSSRKGGRVLKW